MLEPVRNCWLFYIGILLMGSASYLSRFRFRLPTYCPNLIIPVMIATLIVWIANHPVLHRKWCEEVESCHELRYESSPCSPSTGFITYNTQRTSTPVTLISMSSILSSPLALHIMVRMKRRRS
jgi:hypothetical protein